MAVRLSDEETTMDESYINRSTALDILKQAIDEISLEYVKDYLSESGEPVPDELVARIYTIIYEKSRVYLDE